LLPISGKFRFCFFVVCILLFSGCQTGSEGDLAPKKSIRVELSPSLEYLSPAIQACTIQSGDINITLDEKPAAEMGKTGADISLMWGDKLVPEGMQSFRLGSDRLVFTAHKDNPLQRVSVSQAFFLNRAGFDTWGEALSQFCPECKIPANYNERSIEGWHYSSGEDIYAEIAGLSTESPSGGLRRTWLAPTPKDLADAITNNPAAIGWLPARWLNDNLKEIGVTELDPAKQIVPVLAITPGKPDPKVESWLHCLQSAYGN
jgi:DNA-binding transcriptional LysR family regulator